VLDVTLASRVCCERCPGATAENTAHLSRRRQLKAAVFQQPPAAGAAGPAGPAGPADQRGTIGIDPVIGRPTCPQALVAGPGGAANVASGLYRAVTGRIVDVSPHFLTIGDARSEQRFAVAADAMAWHGAPIEPTALARGGHALIRLRPPRHNVADRIWAGIGRVTGTIVQRDSDSLLVEEGITRQKQVVLIPPHAAGRIQVRFPNLAPGFLIDVIGIRRRGILDGLVPATYQPTYAVSQLKAPAPPGRLPDAIAGSATWHDSVNEPHGVLGVSYPAIDPAAGCAEDAAAAGHGQPPGFLSLPYLAVGSALAIRNECTGLGCTLPVTGCAPVARLFNDRCVACGTSPRGRVAELTMASFVALGGELEVGCFNAMITIGI
jgi:hypothetical protein